MGKGKVFSGFNENTEKHIAMDAGSFFKNWNIQTDDYDNAVAAGKLIGATRGGGKFDQQPEIRSIGVDGVKGRAKGLTVIDSWEVVMEANILEISKETLALALAACKIDADTYNDQGYISIKAKNYIDLTDYVDNITYVGKVSGSEKPLIIQVKNALCTGGLSLSFKDKDEAVIAMKFHGHYDPSNLDNPPAEIFYPKGV